MCCPAIPTTTSSILIPEEVSASVIACWIDCMVWVILFTTPRCTPKLLDLPIPRISILPYSFSLPTIATIFVVPISSPTAMFPCSIAFIFLLPLLDYQILNQRFCSESTYYLVLFFDKMPYNSEILVPHCLLFQKAL